MTWNRHRTEPQAGRRRTVGGVVAALVMSVAGVQGFASPIAASSYDPAIDGYSMAAVAQQIGATDFWNAGFTGAGVDVAVIDTGVTPVAGLDAPGKVVYGPDLSFDSQSPTVTNLDANGHGTFMAGLIAGKDAGVTAPYASAPASAYRGIAPDARIVSVKVGAADGAVDVTQVIAAIYWVIEHQHDNGMNIRVLNISFGTDSTQHYLVDPLAYAVEQAYQAGIFVVVAAGNDGPGARWRGNMSNPAKDPFVLAVGASDTMGTPDSSDDVVAPFSASGSWLRPVDVVVPGAHLQGLRVPGSFVDVNAPEGALGDRYFRGSGTSQAAALASGAAALVIQQRPDITPGQLKMLMLNTGDSLGRSVARTWQGNGMLDMSEALGAGATQNLPRYWQSNGRGSIDRARGSHRVTMDGAELTGEVDIFGQRVDTRALARAKGSSWSGGDWNGSSWSGSSWSGSSWSGSSWSGSSWSGSSWSGSSWSGSSWSGSSWSGSLVVGLVVVR